MAVFLRLGLKVYGIAIALCPSDMEIEKGTKFLKRAWTAVAVVELVVAAGVLLFIFSQYFSYSVFVSNLHHEANAANVAQPR